MVTAMETESFPEKCNSDPSLPLSSLRLLVPPLRLAGAAMWHVMQQRDALQYGRMAEFVTLVTETVPDLLTSTQAAQLIQGLRNRFILELCRGDNSADTQTISAHVNRIQSPNVPQGSAVGNDAEVRASQAHFQELLQTLLKDPADREHFFQEVFPVEYGPTYDTALQVLVWEFLCRLEQLLPVPSLLQTTSLLSAAPSGLEECLQCVSHQHQLKTLLQQHKCFGQLATNIGVPSMDECMISSLPLPPLAGVVISSEQTDSGCQSETVQNSITILSSSSFTKEVASECVIDSTDYAGVEVELRTSVGVSEGTGTEERAGCEGALIQGAEEAGRKGPGDEAPHPVSRVIENYGQEHSELNGAGERDEDDLQVQRKREDEGRGTSESSHTPQTSMMVNEATLPSRISTQKKIGADLLIPLKWLPESNNKETFATYHDFSSRKRNAGCTVEENTQVFACSRCLVFHEDEKYLQQHMKTVHPEEYKMISKEIEKLEPPNSTHSDSSSKKPICAPVKSETVSPRMHACSQCGKSFRSPSDRTRHERTHTGERPFHCSQCSKRFITAWDLTRHQRTHEGKYPFYCTQCGESFKCSSELLQHKQIHPVKKQYSCRQCGKNFDSLLERSKHRQTHAVRRQYKCPQCEKSYTRPSDMRRHQRSHTEERPFHCALCGKTFRSASGEKKHQQTHTGERPFPCSFCGKRFTRLPILTRHERIHTGERPYLCSKCGKSFLSLGELSKHQKCHTDERPYLCAHCGKGFKREGTLMKHRRTHTGERPYHCSQCEKTFTDRSGLNRHELIHTGERPYSCIQCGKTFLSSGELLKHQRFHTGERPFNCSLCGKSFTQSCYLKKHERSHTGEKPYQCPQCRKSFSCSTQLKRHSKTHTGEKPFECLQCGKSFSRSCLMKAHLQTHTVKQC